jgi:5-bromo-4-chloroindolyl phosphate hydrolysis protein
MTKETNGNIKWLLGFLLGVIALVTTLLTIGGWIKGTQKDIVTLQKYQAKVEPVVHENYTKIQLIEQDIGYIQEDVKEIKGGVQRIEKQISK